MPGRNDTAASFDFEPVTAMLERRADLHPEKTAVISSAGSLTYRALNESANRIAHRLKALGAGAEDIVMLLLPRAIDVYPATWGILKCGAAFMVANPSYPDDRVEFMSEDSGCRFVISTQEVLADRPELKAGLGAKMLDLQELLCCEEAGNLELPVREDQLCYCIYTSGSTGRPKGVMLEHGNLTNFVYPAPTNGETLGLLERGSVMLAMAPLTFDVSIMEEFLALTSGMTLAQASDEEIRDPNAMKRFMLTQRVDAACMTPAYLNTLACIPEMAPVIRQLKVVDLGAEAFPGALFTRLHGINPDLYIMNGYGPTETTISCTMKVITSAEHITIGRPNANVYAYIIDEQGNELPDGQEGELLICGRGVGRGYIRLPEKTAAAFISFRGMRGYRTGDRALIDENGEIVFHGRSDNQVKLRGLRIELGEVEEVISRHPAVRQAAALAVDNRYLVAYYTLQAPLTKEELKAFARQSLAHYMVPDIFMELKEMPLTANQKIDRKALPRPVMEAQALVPPEDDAQRQILAIVRQVITDLPESVTESMMDYGVSSLDAMMLMASLEDAFGVSFRIADIFANPTVQQLDAFIRKAPKLRQQDPEQPDTAPLNDAQKRRWEIFVADPHATGWTMALLVKTDSSVSAAALRDAVAKAVSVHPVLLCTLQEQDNQVLLHAAPQGSIYTPKIIRCSDADVEQIRLSDLPVFDLHGPMFRATVYETENGVYLYLLADHMILDGDSMDILTEDINRALLGAEPAPEKMSFLQLCLEQAAAAADDTAQQWFRTLLSGMDGCCGLSAGEPDPDGTNMAFEGLSKSMNDVEVLCTDNHVSLTALFCGLLGLTYAVENRTDRAAFEISFNGRSDSRLERTVGYLVQNVPVCCRIDPNVSLAEYLRGVQEQLLRSMSCASQAAECVKALLPACEKHLAICQRPEADTVTLGGKDAQCLDLSGHKSATPARLESLFTLNPMPWGLMLAALFDPSCCSAARAADVCKRFDRILSGAMQGKTIGQLMSL